MKGLRVHEEWCISHMYSRYVCAALTNAFITENTPLAQWSTGLNHPPGHCLQDYGRDWHRDGVSGATELFRGWL